LIAGYPGETKRDFEEMYSFVERSRFERLGIFTYSHEEQTHAFNFEDDVPEEIKQERANSIMELQAGISYDINQTRIGRTLPVLIDRLEGGKYIGRTEYDSPEVDNEVLVNSETHHLRIGDFVNIKIHEATEFDLIGIPDIKVNA
jgi:ribosomal protein S12 methylthiotransferase